MSLPALSNFHHWAVQIGDKWWEVYGDGYLTKNPNDSFWEYWYNIWTKQGDSAPMSSCSVKNSTFVGTTRMTDKQILKFSKNWIKKHPTYHLTQCNCQMFVTELVDKATNGNYKLPPLQKGDFKSALDAIKLHIDDGELHVETKRIEKKFELAPHVRGKVAAPHAKGGADWGKDGNYGGFVEASLYEVEGELGPVGGQIRLNADTGAGIRDGNVNVKFLGTGFEAGKGGIKLQLPLVSVKLKKFW